jgi:hypothetical protein
VNFATLILQVFRRLSSKSSTPLSLPSLKLDPQHSVLRSDSDSDAHRNAFSSDCFSSPLKPLAFANRLRNDSFSYKPLGPSEKQHHSKSPSENTSFPNPKIPKRHSSQPRLLTSDQNQQLDPAETVTRRASQPVTSSHIPYYASAFHQFRFSPAPVFTSSGFHQFRFSPAPVFTSSGFHRTTQRILEF